MQPCVEPTIAIDRARSSTWPPRACQSAHLVEGNGRGALDDAFDHFDHDGRRYVIARRNDSQVTGIEELSEREREVLAYAAIGHDNKVIAYELGLAAATVACFCTAAPRSSACAPEPKLSLARWVSAAKKLPRR